MNKELYPTFPLKCVACDAKHDGHIDNAIDDGWNVAVYDTKSDGRIQFAGCPNHFNEMQTQALDYIKGKQK